MLHLIITLDYNYNSVILFLLVNTRVLSHELYNCDSSSKASIFAFLPKFVA